MNRILLRGTVVASCAAVLVAGGVAPAFAAEAPSASASRSGSGSSAASAATLQQVQARGAAEISQRLTSITAAVTRVDDAKDATASDRQTILSRLSADQTGLTALQAKIAADTTLPTARADVASIFTTYRVYAVVLSQSHLALGADRLTGTAIPDLQKAHDALAERGANAAQLAAMQSDIDAAAAATSGLAGTALAVTPADYNANHAVMTPLRSRLDQAVSSVKQAIAIAKSLRGSLKSSGTGTSGSSTSGTGTSGSTPSATASPSANS